MYDLPTNISSFLTSNFSTNISTPLISDLSTNTSTRSSEVTESIVSGGSINKTFSSTMSPWSREKCADQYDSVYCYRGKCFMMRTNGGMAVGPICECKPGWVGIRCLYMDSYYATHRSHNASKIIARTVGISFAALILLAIATVIGGTYYRKRRQTKKGAFSDNDLVTTTNNTLQIPVWQANRMEVITIHTEKLSRAQKFLLPKLLRNHGLTNVVVPENSFMAIEGVQSRTPTILADLHSDSSSMQSAGRRHSNPRHVSSDNRRLSTAASSSRLSPSPLARQGLSQRVSQSVSVQSPIEESKGEGGGGDVWSHFPRHKTTLRLSSRGSRRSHYRSRENDCMQSAGLTEGVGAVVEMRSVVAAAVVDVPTPSRSRLSLSQRPQRLDQPTIVRVASEFGDPTSKYSIPRRQGVTRRYSQ